jgi:hypothetical protein
MTQQNVGSKRTASSTGGTIAAKSHETAEQMKEAVVDQVNQVRDKAQSAKDHTSDRIRGVATQLRGVGDTLREEDPLVAGLADRASDGVENLARYVSSATPQSFVRDTENLARRQPALFFGGAFLLGLAAGRFLKSSAPAGSYSSGSRGYGSDADVSAGNRERRPSGFFPSDQSQGSETQGSDRSTRSNYRFQENYDATFGRESTGLGNTKAADLEAGVKSEFGSPAVPRRTGDGTSSASQSSGKGNLP